MVTVAVEFLTRRYEMDADAAHDLLARFAARDRLPVTDVACRLINEHSAPDSDGEVRAGIRPALSSTTGCSAHDVYVRMADSIREVRSRGATPIGKMLDDLATIAVQTVSGAQYAGITATDGRSRMGTGSTVGGCSELLDLIQRRYQEGPCVDALRDRNTVRVDDLTTDNRWPDYQREALAHTAVRSTLSYPLVVDQHVLGALSLYADQPDAFDADAERLGFVYATHASLAWDALRRESQLREALGSRDIIGQAKGMLMERHQISSDEAFNLLRQLSQQSNTRVAEIARRLVAAAPPNRQ